jgi:hypothetical protein
MKKDYSDLTGLPDKKLRTLRNNINNRLETFRRGGDKNLPPSHMLHGLDEAECAALQKKVQDEMYRRSKS